MPSAADSRADSRRSRQQRADLLLLNRSVWPMQNEEHVIPDTQRKPWNKGKLIGAKPPLRPKHVWSIRTKLQIGGRARDLAMFNLAIDSKLRGCGHRWCDASGVT